MECFGIIGLWKEKIKMKFKHQQPCDCDICFHQKEILKQVRRILKKLEKQSEMDYYWDGKKRVKDNLIIKRNELNKILSELK